MRTAGLLALAIFFPAFAHAAVVINEIMYEGSATHDWIEVQNNGTSPIDIIGFKFFEANTNHGLKLDRGSSIIPVGGYAVIANATSTFLIDFPAFVGTLFDSSFDLNSTGESLKVCSGSCASDGSNTENSLPPYTPFDISYKDDSLQLASGAWIAAAPTPGAANANVPSDTSGTTDTTDTTTTDSSTQEQTTSSSSGGTTTYTPPPSALTVDAGSNKDATMEVPLHFNARATIKGGAVDPSANIVWGFGDGSSAEGSAVEKTYRYAGTYLVVVTATDGVATGRDEFIVTVRPARVRILGISDTGIMIANEASERLDLSGWALFADKGSFRIPNGTVILPKASILFPSTITKLLTTLDVTLAYPDGPVAARYVSQPYGHDETSPSPAAAVQSVVAAQPFIPQTSFNTMQMVEPIINTKANIQKNEKAVLAPADATELAAAGAALPPSVANTRASHLFRSPWTLGLLGVILVAGSIFIFI